MNEIKHPLKEQFLVIIENDILLSWFTPKDLWMRFDLSTESVKWQTYSLIKKLVKYGYIYKVYDEVGNLYYSETDKLTDFRLIHCKAKATKILNEKLRLLNLEQAKKDMEIQVTRELSKQLPEINFCLNNYIKNNKNIIEELNNKKNVICNIIKNIESYIY